MNDNIFLIIFTIIAIFSIIYCFCLIFYSLIKWLLLRYHLRDMNRIEEIHNAEMP
jgi:ABC-type multidrug transport system permease subunit